VQPYWTDGQVTVYHGDFRDVLREIRPASVEAILTDPPYPREYQQLYADLAALAPRVLIRGGSLLEIVPHYNLPFVLAATAPHLKYRWIVAMVQQVGAHPRMAMGIEVCWKPVVWWVHGAWPRGRGFRRDRFYSTIPQGERRKKHHPWEQNISWAHEMLRFVPDGGLVCDPFLGAGTMLVAARARGYRAIGIDVDERCCAITVERLQGPEATPPARIALELARPAQPSLWEAPA
jgi:site-specific DNA-methyltransferase (adenine-specific)